MGTTLEMSFGGPVGITSIGNWWIRIWIVQIIFSGFCGSKVHPVSFRFGVNIAFQTELFLCCLDFATSHNPVFLTTAV